MTCDELAARARAILGAGPDPVVRYRLLRDVVPSEASPAALEEAARAARRSPHVLELARAQQPDGSWGRFHSEDRRGKARFPTTEYAVERTLALGLDRRHPVLARATAYMTEVLEGRRTWPDPPEKNDRWPAGVRLITGATLALVDPWHPALDGLWDLWREIAERVFRSGDYDPHAEALAHRELTGASVRDSYLVIDNKYALALLGGRASRLPDAVARALLDWVCRKPRGIRYLGVALRTMPSGATATPGALDRWLRSWEILSLFPQWPEFGRQAMEPLWERQEAGGLWDLGPRPGGSPRYPLSADWRSPARRRADHSTRVLALLARYVRQEQAEEPERR